MSRRAAVIASLVTSAAPIGCFPSFDGLSGGLGTADAHVPLDRDGQGVLDVARESDLDASSCGSGDACADVSCDGPTCLAAAGTALRFDGNQVVHVAPGPINDITVEMWLKTKQSVNVDPWFDGASLYEADKAGNANDYGAAIVHDGFAFGTGNPDVTALSKTSVNTGAWFHVAATRVEATGVVRIYVNGNLETILSTGNTSPLADAQAPWIGGILFNGQNVVKSFVGTIDELRVWNVARTSDEIASTMRLRLRGDEAGLVGCWHFDEGMGATADDSSPVHNDGSLGDGYPDLAPAWERSDAPLMP
jgi:hypothetical protein